MRITHLWSDVSHLAFDASRCHSVMKDRFKTVQNVTTCWIIRPERNNQQAWNPYKVFPPAAFKVHPLYASFMDYCVICPFMDQRGQVVLALMQPRCSSLCACSYFAVVVYKVLVLLVEELGGSNTFLTRFSGKPFRINTGPCCCCCMCLPRVPMSRYLPRCVCFFYTDCSFAQTVPLCLWIQTAVVLAEDRSAPVCNPEDGALCLLHSIMDQWQLWPVGCKKTLHFSKMHTHTIESEACRGFPLAWDHRCCDLD